MEWIGRVCRPATSRSRQRRREHCDGLNQAAHCLPHWPANQIQFLDMSEIADQLPTDIDALQALVAAARAERDAAIAERDQALSQMDRLRHLLRQLQRAQFGRRSEKLDPEQLLLALEDVEQAVAGNEAAEDKKDPAGASNRANKRR